ncbi:Putative AC transposase [Morus notabilis]|uniref:Putative AC transposase n=1 Tax=Morus notabilis TaxID=981085 RepID=W9QQ53_9ROSA|nr:Putative AC transposase [Morus notabilis]
MDSFGYSGIPVDAQHNVEEGQFPTNEFVTQQMQSTNPSHGGRTGGRGRNSGRGEVAASATASASASASVATSRRKCKRTSTVWDHFDIIDEVDNEGITCTDQFSIIKAKIYEIYSKYEIRFISTNSRVQESQQQDENPHSFLNVFGLKKKKKKTTQTEVVSGSGSSSTSGSGGSSFNELMAHLSEGLVVGSAAESFDLVQWWRARALTWPILTRLAMDIFSIPVSTISSEQAFSTTGRILEERRNALQRDIVEALVWIGLINVYKIQFHRQAKNGSMNLID